MMAPFAPRSTRSAGFTLLELLTSVALMATLSLLALPLTAQALDEARTLAATRYLASRIASARMHAVARGDHVGFRFVSAGDDYLFTEYADGNGNGLRTSDILAAIDRQLGPSSRLAETFGEVRFGLLANVPDLDARRDAMPTDGVRVGASQILSLGPDGTCSSGSLYLHGRSVQYAVRLLGATGRTRLFRFDPGRQQWTPR